MKAPEDKCSAIFEVHKGQYSINTDQERLDIDVVYKFLHNSWWAKDRPKTVQLRAIKHSLCFNVYDNQKQIGFARVVTDYAVYAYIMDLFILPEYQGKGLGKWLTKTILQTPALKTVLKWSLTTSDKQEFYTKVGFTSLENPQQAMELLKKV